MDDEVQFAILMRLMMDDFFTWVSSCSNSGLLEVDGKRNVAARTVGLVRRAHIALGALAAEVVLALGLDGPPQPASSQMQQTSTFWPPSPPYFRIRSGWSATWRICMMRPKMLA